MTCSKWGFRIEEQPQSGLKWLIPMVACVFVRQVVKNEKVAPKVGQPSFNPITVQTMQLIAGDPTLQFRFVNQKTDPINPVTYNIIYDPVTKKLHCPAGILQHMTLGIDNITSSRGAEEYFFWDMAEYLSPILGDPNKRYYLYAKCENTGDKTDGTGIFLLSETAIAMEAETGYYYFLVGLLNSEYENDRSFATMYGYTEVLPGRITTDKIVSSDGESVIDLINSILKLGDKFLFSSFEEKLQITGADIYQKDLSGDTVLSLLQDGAAMFGKGNILLNADGSASFGNGKNLLNADGSEQLADNNINWSSSGDMTVTGKYRSAEAGQRFEIDPADNKLKMYDSSGNMTCQIHFSESMAILSLFFPGANKVTTISAGGSSFANAVTLDLAATFTSDPHVRGMVWRQGTDLKISEG